jgi:hypothetical protein
LRFFVGFLRGLAGAFRFSSGASFATEELRARSEPLPVFTKALEDASEEIAFSARDIFA